MTNVHPTLSPGAATCAPREMQLFIKHLIQKLKKMCSRHEFWWELQKLKSLSVIETVSFFPV